MLYECAVAYWMSLEISKKMNYAVHFNKRRIQMTFILDLPGCCSDEVKMANYKFKLKSSNYRKLLYCDLALFAVSVELEQKGALVY